jgi:hypothetical protein
MGMNQQTQLIREDSRDRRQETGGISFPGRIWPEDALPAMCIVLIHMYRNDTARNNRGE